MARNNAAYTKDTNGVQQISDIVCIKDSSTTSSGVKRRSIKRKRKNSSDCSNFDNTKSRKPFVGENKNDQMQDKTCEDNIKIRKENKQVGAVSKSDENIVGIKRTNASLCENLTISPHTLEIRNEVTENFKTEADASKKCKTCDELFSIHAGTRNSQFQAEIHTDNFAALMTVKSLYHDSEHTDKKSVRTCPLCTKEQNTIKSLVDHIAHAHSVNSEEKHNKKLVCTDLKESNDDTDKAENSITNEDVPKIKDIAVKSVEKTGQATCPVCGLTVLNYYNFCRHFKRMHTEKRFSCSKCDMKFAKKDELEKHSESHIANFECTVDNCGKTFPTEASYSAHKAKHDSKRNICSVCGKILPSLSKLKYHMTYHSDDRIHKCDECEKSFKTRDVLTKHLRTHKSTRHYYCETCGAGFDQSGALQRHLLVHTDIKPHQCTVCGIEYRSIASLKAHKLRANHYSDDDKKTVPAITCDTCGKEFLARYEYKRHLVTHTDEKPFTCNLCFKSFNDKSNLRQHSKIHENDRPHSCGTCNRSFIQPRSLRKHLAESGHSDKAGNKISLPADVKVDKDDVSFPCLSCNRHFTDWKTLHEHQASSGHFEFDKILEYRPETCNEKQITMHPSPEKPVSVMSNFELLSAAASHVEKLAQKKGATDVLEKQLDKRDKSLPLVEEKLDKIETTLSFISTVSHQSEKPFYDAKLDRNSNNVQNIPGSGSGMLKLVPSDETAINSNVESTEFWKTKLHTGDILHKYPGYKILGLNTDTSTGNMVNAKTYPESVQPTSRIILFKVNSNPASVPLSASNNTGSNILYSKIVSSSSKLTIQPGFVNTAKSGSKFISINTTSSPRDVVQSTDIPSVNTELKSSLESQNVAQTISNISLNYQSEFENLNTSSKNGVLNKSPFHGTILRNIKTGSVSSEQKSDCESTNIIQGMNSESFDTKTDSDSTHIEVNTNSDSGKMPDFCFDSETIMHNVNAKSENIDVNSYLDENGNAFVDSPSKTHSDSENTLSNTNTDNGNIFMNFLQEDPFSHNLYLNKPATSERQFDPFFYNNSTSQIFCPSTSAETWTGSTPSLTSTLLQQDSKYISMEPVYSVPFNSSSEPNFSLPFTSSSTDASVTHFTGGSL